MSLTKISTKEGPYSFLDYVVNDNESIASVCESVSENNYIPNFAAKEWHILPLYDVENGKSNMVGRFNSIENLIDNCPDNFQIIAVGISSIPYGHGVWHTDPITTKEHFKRLHIPISNIDGSSLSIIKDGNQIDYKWEIGNLYQFANAELTHRPSYFGDKTKRRLILMIDGFLDCNYTKNELIDYWHKTMNNLINQNQIQA